MSNKKVSLTFDNGPTPGVTEAVLDTLRRHGIAATFFVVGENVETPAGRDLLRRIAAEGHRLGNHTYTHTVLFGAEEDQGRVIAEIDRTQALLGDLGAERLFRPYGGGGHLDKRVMSRTGYDHLRAQGYTMVLWNSIPGDWMDPDGWPDTACRHIAEHDWTVTVVHDLPTGAMASLERFLTRAHADGVEFRTDFPAELVPLVAGTPILPIDAILSDR